MGLSDVCASATFNSVTAPAPVYSYWLPLRVVDESGQDSGLEVTANEQQRMAQVAVPVGRSGDLYWSEPSLVAEPNQLDMYGGTVRFVVEWESSTTGVTSAVLDSTRLIVVGRRNTALRFRVTPTTLTAKTTTTLEAELSVENAEQPVSGDQGRVTRTLMLLTLADVRLLLLPASFHHHSHISRLLLLWPPYVIGGPLYFCPVISIFFFYLILSFFIPRLISAAADWMSTIL